MYFAMGQEDIVAIIEAPDDQSVAAMSMVIAASGSFSAGAATKLMTAAEAVGAMEKAQSAVVAYSPPS